MTDPGLDNRLRQHSRRAGLMVGLTMALTIAICIGAATLIYALLVPAVGDLVPIAPQTGGARTVAQPQAPDGDPAAAPPAPQVDGGAAQAPAPAPTAEPAEPTPTPETFTPTHQISANESVNFRAGPSRSDPILQALPPATPLQYLGEDAPASDPNDAPRWMRFKITDGTEGWVREIDTEPYQP